MHPLVKAFRDLGELGELLEPSGPPVAPGIEHVMIEIAPGVFRSQHRQKRAQAGRLLQQLAAGKQLHDAVRLKFSELQERANAGRRSQR